MGQLTLQALRARWQHFCWCTILHGLFAAVFNMAASGSCRVAPIRLLLCLSHLAQHTIGHLKLRIWLEAVTFKSGSEILS